MPTTLSTFDAFIGEIKVRYQEPYVTEGLNAAKAVIVPRGTHRGFRLAPNATALTITFLADPVWLDHVAQYLTNDMNDPLGYGHTLTIRRLGGNFTAVLPPSEQLIIAIYSTYTTSSATTAVINAYTFAEYAALPLPLQQELLILGTVTTPAVGVIPAANISHLSRIFSGMEFGQDAIPFIRIIDDPAFAQTGLLATENISGLFGLPWFFSDMGTGVKGVYSKTDPSSKNQLDLSIAAVGTYSFTFHPSNAFVSVQPGQMLRARIDLKVLQVPGSGTLQVNFVFLDINGNPVAGSGGVSISTAAVDSVYRTIDVEFIVPTGSTYIQRVELLGTSLVYAGTGDILRVNAFQAWMETLGTLNEADGGMRQPLSLMRNIRFPSSGAVISPADPVFYSSVGQLNLGRADGFADASHQPPPLVSAGGFVGNNVANEAGVIGNGSGTGPGVQGNGGPTNGTGVAGQGGGANGVGVVGTGGTTGVGVEGQGGTGAVGVAGTGGAGATGVTATGGTGNTVGLQAFGKGTGMGVFGIGGATGSPDGTFSSAGVYGVGGDGSANGHGVYGQGAGANSGVYGIGGGSAGNGVEGQGVGISAGVVGTGGPSAGSGVFGQGGASGGGGVAGTGGAGSGEGGFFVGGTPNGSGAAAAGTGTGTGLIAFGGPQGPGIQAFGGGLTPVGSHIGVKGFASGNQVGIQGTGGPTGGADGTTAGAGVQGVGGGGNSHGVYGSGTGNNAGVYGIGGAANANGVEGQGASPTGNGVVGTGGTGGAGVQGFGGGSSGIGGQFEGGGPAGIGVAATGLGVGIGGQFSGGAYGVQAFASSTGTGVGVQGNGGATGGHGVEGIGGPNSAGGYFTPGSGQVALHAHSGSLEVDQTIASPSTDPGQNQLWADNICKCFGKVTTTASSSVTVNGGYNVFTAVAGNSPVNFIDVQMAHAMANTNYTILATAGDTGQDVIVGVISTLVFRIAFNSDPTSTAGLVFNFSVFGPQ